MSEGAVTRIGRCDACAMRPRVLAPGSSFCVECLELRGLHWSQTAARIRREPAFRDQVFESIRTQAGKQLFLAMFGESLPSAGESQ